MTIIINVYQRNYRFECKFFSTECHRAVRVLTNKFRSPKIVLATLKGLVLLAWQSLETTFVVAYVLVLRGRPDTTKSQQQQQQQKNINKMAIESCLVVLSDTVCPLIC